MTPEGPNRGGTEPGHSNAPGGRGDAPPDGAPPDDAARGGAPRGHGPRGNGPREDARSLPRWLVPGLIGLVTITAGVLTWRAGQLSSAAAFQDRQSVSQTISQQAQITEAGLATLNEATGYVSYTADLAEAAALEDLAVAAEAQGRSDVAADLRARSDTVRAAATRVANVTGVLDSRPLFGQQLTGPDELQPFDMTRRFKSNEADLSSRVRSAGVLEPQRWADRADATRARVRALRVGALYMLVAVAAYTIAELARRRSSRLVGFTVGGVVYVVALVALVPGAW